MQAEHSSSYVTPCWYRKIEVEPRHVRDSEIFKLRQWDTPGPDIEHFIQWATKAPDKIENNKNYSVLSQHSIEALLCHKHKL